jgi:hypothetical protein
MSQSRAHTLEDVHLANQHPRAGAPSRGKEEDEDGDEGDLGIDGGDVVGALDAVDDRDLVEADGDTDDGDNELADHHAEGAPHEQGTAAEALDGPEGEGRRADVDEGEDKRDQERVADGAGGLQEGGRVVEDLRCCTSVLAKCVTRGETYKVDTGPLLHHLERSAEDGATQVALGVPEAAGEAGLPGPVPVGGGRDLALVFSVGDDLGKLLLDVGRVEGLASEAGEDAAGIFNATALDVEARGVGQEEEADGEDEGPRKLDGDGDAVRAGVGAVLGGIGDARRQKKADGDAELVAGDESATDLARGDFGHVEDDDGRDEADAEAGNQAAGDDEAEARREGGLEDDANGVDAAAGNDRRTTAHHVGQITCDERTLRGRFSVKKRDDAKRIQRRYQRTGWR